MKNKRIRIAYLLTTFIFLFTYIGLYFGSIKTYAEDYKNYEVATIATLSAAPKSGSFKSNGSKSYTKPPKTTYIKPDSGSFSTKPNTNTTKPGSSSTIKPDSGSFSTKPSTDKPSTSNTDKNYNDTSSSGGGYSRPLFGGGFFGGYNPLSRMFYGFSMSNIIMNLVIIITVIVVVYIIIDYIRSRRD